MEKVIKTLIGHSGSTVTLVKQSDKLIVRKVDNVERNHERLMALIGWVDIPKIYKYDGTTLEMEYIHGMDIKTHLTYYHSSKLISFLHNTIDVFRFGEVDKDYTEVYTKSLAWIDGVSDLPFSANQLIERLPKILPESMYHGDLTLENIIYSPTGRFYLIDPVTLQYDSWIFDIAKLRQDIDCKWFLRNSSLQLDPKLYEIRDSLYRRYPEAFDDHLLILMLLRVYLHCDKQSPEYTFIMKEIEKLWKL